MTLDLKLSNRRVWKCDQCGKRDTWQDGWRSFGSIAMMEVCPEDVPTTCSDKCKLAFQAGMLEGEIEVPTVKLRGPCGSSISGKRRGY